MTWVRVEVGNAQSRVQGLPPGIFRLLRYELSYQSAEPSTRRFLQRDGSIKIVHWDGYNRLLDKHGIFPSGLIPRTVRLLRKWGVACDITDRREHLLEGVPMWSMPDDFELRDYQRAACDAAERAGRGVIDSPPRTGKTLMMAELIRRISASRVVVTAPTEPIAAQTHQKLLDLFAKNDWSGMVQDCSSDFYLLTGGPPKTRAAQRASRRARVFVATVATAAGMSEDWWDGVDCLIVDERHHQAAKTYRDLNMLARNAFWRWGFTGTNYRSSSGEQVALEACLGRTVASFSIPEMIERGVLVKAHVEFWPIDYPGIKQLKFSKGYRRGVVESDIRNRMIVYCASVEKSAGRKVLILVHRIDHGTWLQSKIAGSRFVQGSDGPEVRKAVAQLDAGGIQCLIGSPVVGEGLDCPAADTLIYAKGFKARVTHTQDTFRVLTADGVKTDARIIDFADRHNQTLLEHSVERMRNYQAMGMTVTVKQQLPVDIAQLSLYD